MAAHKGKRKCIICGKEFEGFPRAKFCSKECQNTKIPTEDHVGEKYSELTIKAAYRKKSILFAICECSCGNICEVRYDCLISGNTKSCGHLGEENKLKPAELQGEINAFGIRAIRSTGKKSHRSIIWECECPCGNVFEVESAEFWGRQSCGCLPYKYRVKNMEKARVDYCLEGTSVSMLKSGKIPKNNTSGVKGVHYRKDRGTWVAQIEFRGKHYYLGSFHKKEDAIKARKLAEEKLFNNFLDWYAKEHPEKWEKLNKKNKTNKTN